MDLDELWGKKQGDNRQDGESNYQELAWDREHEDREPGTRIWTPAWRSADPRMQWRQLKEREGVKDVGT